MFKSLIFIITASLTFSIPLNGQNTQIEGYVFEEGNRGYLNEVELIVFDQQSDELVGSVISNLEGYFTISVPSKRNYRIEIKHDEFNNKVEIVSAKQPAEEAKIFLKIELTRSPGYIFEVMLAPKRETQDITVDAIKGAMIEVYNNTSSEEVMKLEDHPRPDFRINLKNGNHYTILIRKEGYLTKRMEAYVNVKGCILCFEGVGDVQPGVADNLTNGLTTGVLLANVEMQAVSPGKIIELQNINYELGRSSLKKQGKEELKKLKSIMYDNPYLTIELGSHTDIRGKASANQTLSLKRATAVVDYLTQELDIRKDRVSAIGYGESNIKNKCKSGVECSESEHAENRRTEIKVLKLDYAMHPPKSLFSLKKEEEFERMILDEGTETFQGEDQQKELIEPNITDLMTVTKKEVVDNNIEVGENKSSHEITMAIKADRSSDTTDLIEKSNEVDKKLEEIKNAKKAVVVIKDNVEEKQVTDLIANANQYSGYRIVIHFSAIPLPENHEIYKKNKTIIEYETPQKNILYMIGEFDTKEEAEKHRVMKVEEDYANSYVVEFKNGIRTK